MSEPVSAVVPPRAWLPLAGLVASAAILAAGHVSARFAFAHGVNVMTAATTRSVVAAALLLLLLRLRGSSILPLSRESMLAILLGFAVASQTIFVQVAVLLMPVTLAILVFYTYPFLTGVVTSVLGMDRLTPSLFVALVAAFAGLTMVLGVSGESVNLLGVLAALGASISFTVTLILTPRLAPGLAAPVRTFLMLGFTAIIFVAAAGATGDFQWPTSDLGQLGLAGLVVFYSVGIILLFLCLPMLGPTHTAVILNTEPVFVAIVAWLALGETLSPLQLVGALIVVGAVMFFQLRKGRG